MPASAPFAALHVYLQRLPDEPSCASSVSRTADGRAQAQFFDDNYRRNGFRLAFAVTTISDAIDILNRFQPHAIELRAMCTWRRTSE